MSLELRDTDESAGFAVRSRRRSGALLLVAALFVVTWISLVRADPPIVSHDSGVALLIAALGGAGALLAAFLSLLGFAAQGRRLDLLVGVGFCTLAIESCIIVLGVLATGSGSRFAAEAGVVSITWLVASALFLAAVFSPAIIPAPRRGPALRLSLAGVALGALAGGTWALSTGGGPGRSLDSGAAMLAAILSFAAAGALWRRMHIRPSLPYLEYFLCVGGFTNIQLAVHPASASSVAISDVEGVALSLGAGVAAAVAFAVMYVRAGSYGLELAAIRSLGASSAESDVATLSKYIARVVGDLIDAQVRLLTVEAEEGDEDLLAPTGHPGTHRSRLVVTMERGANGTVSVGVPLSPHGRRLGTLVATRPAGSGFSEAEIELLEVCGVQAGLLLERSVLREEVAAAAVVEERSRLAREVHDGLAQHLAFLKMRVAWVRRARGALDADQLEDVETVLETALAEARHAITTLRSEPQGGSTADAIAGFAAEFGQVSGLSVQVVHDATVPEVGPKARVELLRIVQEALNNARKHAGASQLAVAVRARGRGVEVSVEDDGTGFDPAHKEAGHYGIEIMRERAESIGGHFELTSSPDMGTRIRVWAPALEAPGGSDRRAG